MNRNWLLALFLMAATFAAYQPVWHAAFGWDDGKLIGASVHDGLRHIWTEQGEPTLQGQRFEPGEQYYPLTFTTFWLEYHLWGMDPPGYHLDNVLLHGLNAVLLALVLRRLSVPGAWLAAAIWALHPVNVESAAWITERKNTLSGLFYLGSILAALKYWLPEARAMPQSDDGRLRIENSESQSGLAPAAATARGESLRTAVRPTDGRRSATSLPQRGPVRFYWFALGLYVLALLSKTSTLPLPVVVLLLVWWKRGAVLWSDVRPLLLFVAAGIAMGLDTMHVEHRSSAPGAGLTLPLVDRCLIAGRDVWFYLGKLIWPHPLMLIYPRWIIDSSSVWTWLQALAVPAVLLVLWLKRHSWGRPILVAFLYFLALLALVLGFLQISYFSYYSFVADHFQYLACMGPLTLAAAGIATGLGRFGNFGRVLAVPLGAGLLVLLGTLTWNQCRMYSDLKTIWATTVARNPEAYLARYNLGDMYARHGQVDAAIEQFSKAMQIRPDEDIAVALANALVDKGKPDEAIPYYRLALQTWPDFARAYNGLGRAYLAKGQPDAAIQNLQRAVDIQTNLENCYDVGCAYAQIGKLDLAIRYLQQAAAIQPDFAPAHNNLANVFMMKGQVAQAEEEWRAALKVEPDMVEAQMNLAWALATCPEASLRNGGEAVALAQMANQRSGGRDPAILRVLAAADAETGQFQEATAVAQGAMEVAALRHNEALANAIQAEMKFYQNGQPYREDSK